MISDNSLAVFAKRDCPTCQLVAPVIRALAAHEKSFKVFSQDDPGFPEQVGGVIGHRDLEQSFRHNIEIVPTLIRFEHRRDVDALPVLIFCPAWGADQDQAISRRAVTN